MAKAAVISIIPPHVSWLHDTGERLQTACGREIEIRCSRPTRCDRAVGLGEHFRQHYITDADLPAMVDGTELSPTPNIYGTCCSPMRPRLHRDQAYGRVISVRFSSRTMITVSCTRLLESRETLRYQDRWNRNDSTKGCDIIGFKFATDRSNP